MSEEMLTHAWPSLGSFHMYSFHSEKAATRGPAFGNSPPRNVSIIDGKQKDSTKEANLLLIPGSRTWVCLEASMTKSSQGQWLYSVRPTILSALPSPKLSQAT